MAISLRRLVSEFFGSGILAVLTTVLPAVMDNQQHAAANELENQLGHHVAYFGRKLLLEAVQYIIQISGAQLNPAVTVALAVYAHMNPYDAVAYIASQALGAIAVLLLAVRFHPAVQAWLVAPAVLMPNKAILREFFHTFDLLYRLAAATEQDAAAYATIMLDVLPVGLSVGAWMNPACTLGHAIATRNYIHVMFKILAQIVGAIAGLGANKLWSILLQM